MKVLFVESNIEEHAEFSLTSIEEACNVADILVILVRHKFFLALKGHGGTMLDFCGAFEN